MKRIIAIALTLSLVFAMGAFSVSAADKNVSSASGTTDIEVTVAQTYTVVIPDKIDSTGSPVSIGNIKATTLRIPEGKKLTVAAEVTGGVLTLKDSTVTISASCPATVRDLPYYKVATDAVDMGDVTATIANDTLAGLYKGTLTFTFAVTSTLPG